MFKMTEKKSRVLAAVLCLTVWATVIGGVSAKRAEAFQSASGIDSSHGMTYHHHYHDHYGHLR